ncbi:MAG: hypothetical protein ACTSUF_03590 [Candidatus Heimdallarchaeaceae archaeon]
MDKDSLIIIVCGAGIFLGFFAFLSYLAFLSRQQGCSESQTEIQKVYIQKEPIKTEETIPTKPNITNHILNEAGKWYEIPIPPDIKTWSMNARGEYDIFYSFDPSHSTYRTLFSGMFLDSDTMPSGITPNAIYVSSNTAGAVVEIAFFR